jgi:hypothetical protein
MPPSRRALVTLACPLLLTAMLPLGGFMARALDTAVLRQHHSATNRDDPSGEDRVHDREGPAKRGVYAIGSAANEAQLAQPRTGSATHQATNGQDLRDDRRSFLLDAVEALHRREWPRCLAPQDPGSSAPQQTWAMLCD